MTTTARLKVMTVVGTRPEIIRLSETIKRLDEYTDHVLVHTGQNYDYELNEVFFEDLGLRRPDIFLGADTSSLGAVLGTVMTGVELAIRSEKPDAFLVLGDTNSCISAVIAKRMKVPVFHMEAGNRSFDENVPEETNRKLVDHVADYNLAYTEHARRNLLSEGLHPSRVIMTGSPMREVLEANRSAIDGSDILERLDLAPKGYFLASVHREENVDNSDRLRAVVASLKLVSEKWGKPVLVSTHPRTRKRLEESGLLDSDGLVFHPPFGFLDYVRLQMDAQLVLSDSGTIAEESSLLGFPAVTLRDFIERPEAIDSGSIITTGVESFAVVAAIEVLLAGVSQERVLPAGYEIHDTSRRVLNFILSAAHSHRARLGLR
ncbi:non-hydrolyzing UDP-N-acetylglucosamine 2-epimerase [Leifsonia sp. Root1293]|nr:UDP-N-acetylglucosamine 2-epimerase (non-hydrolyzing) [Leifsonia sp. Root1293]KQX05665.1 UDP-N-acetyl glucosamine 2-epimerase [Leifsonia sp. Root1293]KRA09301.1 UDP-N-acetyl glucosamine 2-epimerase [Leifsonia sp. Root60]